MEQRIYTYMLDCSEKIITDIKKISHRFIEIDDINSTELPVLNEDAAQLIDDAIEKILNINLDEKTIQELAVIYKKLYFLSQYIEFLLKSDKGKKNQMLLKAAKDLSLMKEKMLSNPSLFDIIMRTKGFEDDKKLMKSSKKTAKKNRKEMMFQKRTLSRDDIKNAQMVFSLGAAGDSGNVGLLFRILFIKLMEMIKAVIKWLRAKIIRD